MCGDILIRSTVVVLHKTSILAQCTEGGHAWATCRIEHLEYVTDFAQDSACLLMKLFVHSGESEKDCELTD